MNLSEEKYAPFKLDCFGVLGIILLISGVGSAIISVYGIIDLLKWKNLVWKIVFLLHSFFSMSLLKEL